MIDQRKPLGDRSLNYYYGSVVHGVGGINNGGYGNDLKLISNANACSGLRKSEMISNDNQFQLSSNIKNPGTSCTISKKSNPYTPDHRRRSNAPFKSPITLCFERILGAGKFLAITPE